MRTHTLAEVSPLLNTSSGIEVVRDTARWDALRLQWQQLHEVAGGSWATDFDWLRTWWDIYGGVYGQRGGGLMILAAWNGQQLAAVLPVYLRRPRFGGGGRVATFLGSGEREREEVCPDYLDVLCRPERPQTAGMLLDALMEQQADAYDRLELSDVATASTVGQWGRRRLADSTLEIVPRGACPIADLSGGMDAYLARLSASQRSQLRRLLKQAGSAGAHLEVAAAADFEEYFDELMELHQARWTAAGSPGCFASRRFTEFHRRMARQWLREGKVVLSRLRLDGRTIAVKYGFLHRDKYDFYQSGVRLDADPRLRSPGTVSFLLLFEELIRRGVQRFDFLRGSSNYKERLATTTQALLQVRWLRWTWRTNVACASRFVLRKGGEAVHLLRRPRPQAAWNE